MITFADALASITEDQPPLTIPVGVTEKGTLKALDLAKAPHMFYAGATGSGKSVGLNCAIATLMSRNDPASLRFTMIDPKRVELAGYRRSKFVDAVITDMDEAAAALEDVVGLMESRYRLLEDAGVKNLDAYNLVADEPLAHHVLVVDELADLMDTHQATVLPMLVRLGQLARAAGIHMMLATQRPAADVTPKKLVANIPTRLAFATQSATESRIILGSKGAEDLGGNGDLLASLPGEKGLVRAQGPFITDDDIAAIVAVHELPDLAEAVPAPAEAVEPEAESAPTPTAETTAAVIAEVTGQLEGRMRDAIYDAEAERDKARRERDELSDEVMKLKLELETLRVRRERDVDDVREKTKLALEAMRAEDRAKVREYEKRAEKATRRMTAAEARGHKYTSSVVVSGAIAALLVLGLISIGLTWVAVAAPFVVSVIAGLMLTGSTTAEPPVTTKEEPRGQHLRSRQSGSGR